MQGNILDQYVDAAPSVQTVLDIFKDEWVSKLPGDFAAFRAGQIPIFEDDRIIWFIEQIGGVAGQRLLELGPLEAGHTYMLERSGAASIVAIEANTRAYLKCLIVKEILDLKRVQFLCGNFVEYLRSCPTKFDACLASGVLYHMTNPIELISLLAKVSDRLCLWTHYFDAGILGSNPNLSPKFDFKGVPSSYRGFEHTLFRQDYQIALNSPTFCGGTQAFSHWISRADLLAALRFFGFSDISISPTHDHPSHPNGPCLCLVAKRSPAASFT